MCIRDRRRIKEEKDLAKQIQKDEKQKKQYLKDHLASVRNHLFGPKGLVKKNYNNSIFDLKVKIVDGKNYPKKKIIVAQVLDFSARATGWPPGYDIVIAHVDRNCKKCKKGKNIKIVPIPIANKIPKHNTKALHVVAPETKKKGKGRIYINHILNGDILGDSGAPSSIQVIKHDGKQNPPMLFGASGSPVIFKECEK